MKHNLIIMEKEEKKIDIKKVYASMARKCSAKECSSFDIKRSLQRMSLPENQISEIIALLQENRFIDDKRYVRSFINDKLKINKWGKNKIAFALQQKNIDHQAVNKIFEEIHADNLTDELKPLLEKKAKSIRGNNVFEKRNKLIRFALGRGFEMRDVVKVVNQIYNE